MITRGGVQQKPQAAVSYSNPNVQAPTLVSGPIAGETTAAALAAAFGAPNYAVLPAMAAPTPPTWVAALAS
jgi:hypothetical protein